MRLHRAALGDPAAGARIAPLKWWAKRTILTLAVCNSTMREVPVSLQVGTRAPDFTLPSHLGKDVTLSELRGKNVVLAFFPLAWTPV
jgi:hypothetical protein